MSTTMCRVTGNISDLGLSLVPGFILRIVPDPRTVIINDKTMTLADIAAVTVGPTGQVDFTIPAATKLAVIPTLNGVTFPSIGIRAPVRETASLISVITTSPPVPADVQTLINVVQEAQASVTENTAAILTAAEAVDDDRDEIAGFRQEVIDAQTDIAGKHADVNAKAAQVATNTSASAISAGQSAQARNEAQAARDQAALYAGSFGPGMILHRTDETIPAGWWDTGLRQTVTDSLWGGTSTLALISNWSTASLYSGIATAWFDFSTASRAFQDTIGTAITAPGQSVGMVRDAIASLSFGPELVSNGDFATDTAWTKGSGWTISGGSANKVTGSSTGLSQAVALTARRTYRVSGFVTVSAGLLTPQLLGGSTVAGTSISASGPFEQYLTAVAGSATVNLQSNGIFVGSIDNVSVQEVLGVVATQPSASLRGRWASWPVTGRQNLLTYTEQFDNAAWLKTGVTVTQNAAVGPDGSSTADAIVENTATSSHDVAQSVTVGAVAPHTLSVYAKANGRSWLRLLAFQSGIVSNSVWFNLTSGTVGTVSPGASNVTITNVGNGWYRCSITIMPATASAMTIYARITQTDSEASYAGDGISGVMVWGAQLELGSTATAYQRVVTSDDITQSAVRSAGLWRPDLVDDALTFNLPAAVDGELILMGRDGSWREPRPASAGTAVTIGGTSAGTLATPGILRATGPLVAAGFRAGALTADEWLRLKRRWRAEGARGELLLGPELCTDPTFSNPAAWGAGPNWTVAGGVASFSTGGTSEPIRNGSVIVGAVYLISFDLLTVSAGSVAPTAGSAVGVYTATTGRVTQCVIGAGSDGVGVRASSLFVGSIDNISIRLLTPEY